MLLCAGGVAGVASAATTAAVVEDGHLVVVGTDGDDAITVSTTAPGPSQTPQAVEVDDPAGLTAGTGCVQDATTHATCAAIELVEVAGRDGNDTLVAGPHLDWPILYGQDGADVISGAAEGYGGPGDDDITAADGAYLIDGEDGDDVLHAATTETLVSGGPGDDQLVGGPGDDLLYGDEGNDVLRGERPSAATAADSGADILDGGDGTDVVDYASRTDALTVAVGSGYSIDDGAAGEHDEIVSIEGVVGGSGDDRLTGGSKPSSLVGGAGNDTLLARDGVADEVTCGDGADTAELDPLDVLTALPDPAGGCEQVTVAEYVPPPPPPPPAPAPEPPAPAPVDPGRPPVVPLPGESQLPAPPSSPVPRTPRPPAPLHVVRRRALRHARARLTVHVLPRGALTATATARVDGRSLVVARGHAIALSDRDVVVTLRPTRSGRRAVRRHRALTVGLRLRLALHGETKIVRSSGGALNLRW